MSVFFHNGGVTGCLRVPPSHTPQHKRENAEPTLEQAVFDAVETGAKSGLQATFTTASARSSRVLR